MKRKKRLLKLGSFLIFLTIFTIPFINWKIKNKTHSKYREVEKSIYNLSTQDCIALHDSLIVIEKRINDFTIIHPIPDSLILGDYAHKLEIDSNNIFEIRSDFIGKVNMIDKYYRKVERRSNHIMFLFFIIAHGVLALMNHYINKLVK